MQVIYTCTIHTLVFTDLGDLWSFCRKILQLTVETSWREQVRVNSEINNDGLISELETENRKQSLKK